MINDPSRCDFHAARRLVDRGFERATIERALREASPDLEERKRGHVQDYVRRTVDVAFEIGREREREAAVERANEPTFSRRPHSPEAERDATDLCRREIEKATRLIADPMRRDVIASTRLAEAGYEARTIEGALRAASPDLQERTRGQVERYVKGLADLAVRAQARQIERDRDPDRGMER